MAETIMQSVLDYFKTSWKSLKCLRDRWKYELVGPTTTHLEHELCLLPVMVLFTISSFQGVYKDSFGLYGDFVYIFLVAAWLSRYLLLRCLCMWETSTSRRPTLRGLVTSCITSLVLSGQTFDRPSEASLQKFLGNATNQNRIAGLTDSVPPFLLYCWQMIKVRLYFPVAKALNFDLGPTCSFLLDMIPSVPYGARIQNAAATVIQYVFSMWTSICPSLSSLFNFAILIYIVLKVRFTLHPEPDHANPSSGFASAQQGVPTPVDKSVWKPYGMYQSYTTPDWPAVFCVISGFGILSSLVYVFQIALPIPDQMFGGIVAKEARNDVRASATSNKSARRRDSLDSSSNETARSRLVTTGNRFRHLSFVRLFRMLESVLLCGVLPRTLLICRVTGHCPPGSEVWQLTKVLYPAGITTSLRRDIPFSLNVMPSDRFSAMYCILGIALTSLTLQVAQSVVLSKSTLAATAHMSSEWELARDNKDLASSTVWDPRRKYKKGDLIRFPPSGPLQAVYRAVSNAPEGKPADLQLRLEYSMFENELGHPATSTLLSKAARLEVMVLAIHLFLYLSARILFGYGASSLATATIAHVITAYALTNLGAVKYDELRRLGAEISPGGASTAGCSFTNST